MKRVIITGATSMLGLALIHECIQNNTEVIAIIRENSRKRNLIPINPLISVIECDLAKIHSINIAGKCCYDAFYHLAWAFTDNLNRNLVEEQHYNIEYTLAAVKLASRLRCKKFVGAGSQAEYGRVRGKISADMCVAPDSAYGVAKYTAGRLSSILCQQMGMEFIWMRIFSTYGINDMPSTMIMYTIDCLLKKKKPLLTKCEQMWDYLNCRDAAKAFFLIGAKGKNQAVYNIGSGQEIILSEYVCKIRNLIDSNLPLGIGEREYAPNQIMTLCADISNLTLDTGFVPSISFDEGIKETINWYRSFKLF